MASVIKVLGQNAPAATTLTTLYTVPTSTVTVTSTLTVANRATTASYFRVAVRPAGAAMANQHYLYYDVEIPANDTFAASLGLTLATTDVISVYSSSGYLSFNIFGEEVS